ncbi:MAG: hypothetical protein GQ540_12000 [Lutibacter sp.]|uniref:HIRAN domain-containing protein n=1 Tax=Lutibacter sp. TaxID=1925666 RepID=UPI0019FC0A96|nr:HIRAN domain-containing protein [Lutibacter sp.]NOR29240.1 hypothetical protein [Lutibacter sp.]
MSGRIKFEDRVFYISVRGIRFENSDGSSRTEYLLKLKPNDKLELVKEPDNIFDKHAVKIVYEKNLQIGYVPKELSSIISEYLESGLRYEIKHLNISRAEIGYRLSCEFNLKFSKEI